MSIYCKPVLKACIFLLAGTVAWSQKQVSLGDKREIFVDNYLLQEKRNIEIKMHSPRYEGPVLTLDHPWEGDFSLYTTILKDGSLYRAYYRGIRTAGEDGNENETTCYAESSDGITWKKPDLGLYKINGSYHNNIILANARPATHNFCPFIDTNPDRALRQRYKAVGGTSDTGLIAYVSEDGIHWAKLQEEPLKIKGRFDSQNVIFWSETEELYVCYFRTLNNKIRSVSRATSKDFLTWSEPVAMEFGDTPLEHLYIQQTSPYFRAPHIYVATAARFMERRQAITHEQAKTIDVDPSYYRDCSDAVLLTSRGGKVYDRTFMESFIRPRSGLENWVSRTNFPALNVVQTGPEEMSVYVNEHYAQPSAHLSRYSMRLDGFTSLHAGYAEGEALTKPFSFSGKELEINFATSAAGGIRIEIQDMKGNAVPGFTAQDSQIMIGNEIKRVVSWKENKDVSSLAGKTVRLRILMKDADLYSLKFN